MRLWLLNLIARWMGMSPAATIFPMLPTEPDAVLFVRTDRTPTTCKLIGVLVGAMQADGFRIEDGASERRVH